MSDERENLTEAVWREQLRREELLALQTCASGEEPPPTIWKYHLHLGQEADSCVQRILEMIRIVANTPEDDWPDDDQWRTILPSWFVQSTPAISQQQAEAELAEIPLEQWHMLSWDFASWLDTIRVREWRWWGYQRRHHDLIIYLKIVGWPAHLDALEYMLRTAGADILQRG